MCKALLEEQARVQVYDPQVKRNQMFVEFDYTCGVNKDNTPRLEESVSIGWRAFCSRVWEDVRWICLMMLKKSMYLLRQRVEDPLLV